VNKQHAQFATPLVGEPIIIDEATIALLRSWEAEDETSDPIEVARREKDWQEFKASINEHRPSARPVYK
jgi:hypothetical protein